MSQGAREDYFFCLAIITKQKQKKKCINKGSSTLNGFLSIFPVELIMYVGPLGQPVGCHYPHL